MYAARVLMWRRAATARVRGPRKPTLAVPGRAADEIAALLESHGAKVAVRDAGGDRTLLIVGDIHNLSRRPEAYREFFDRLKGRAKIDRIFMEAVYASQGAADPYLAYWFDVERIRRDRPLTRAEQDELADSLRRQDSVCYFSLKDEYPIVGLETPESVAKAVALSRLATHAAMLYRNGKLDRDIQDAVNRYAKLADEPEFPVQEYPPEMSREDHSRLVEQAKALNARYTLGVRNRQFVDVIDAALRPSETGVLIVGRAHVEPPDPQKAGGTILDGLGEKGINTAYLDILNARLFARRAAKAASR